MKVPIGIAILVGACIIGVVIGFGKSADAPTIDGHNIWLGVGILCSVVTAIGLLWLAIKSGGK